MVLFACVCVCVCVCIRDIRRGTCGTAFVLCDLVKTSQQRVDVGLDLRQFGFDSLQLCRFHCSHVHTRLTREHNVLVSGLYITIKPKTEIKAVHWYSDSQDKGFFCCYIETS